MTSRFDFYSFKTYSGMVATSKDRTSKDRKIAALLALISAVPFLPSGLHKFYLGQPQWGIVYLLLSLTPIPKVASALEGIWYLFLEPEEFGQRFGGTASIASGASSGLMASAYPIEPGQVQAVAEALRQLDQLRQEGLISEYEFEQKRRQMLNLP